MYNLKPLVVNQVVSKNTGHLEITPTPGPSSLSVGPQPLLRENLVTVNAEHIAPTPMPTQHNTNSRPSRKVSRQVTSQVQNESATIPNQSINGQRNGNMDTSSRNRNNTPQQSCPRDEAQRKTERELTEWLNDAYKRKR